MKQKAKPKSRRKLKKPLLVSILLAGCGAAFYALLARRGFVMPPSAIPAVLCSEGCSSEKPIHPILQGSDLLNADRPLSELLGEGIEREKISISIEKSKYRLTLFSNLQPVKSYAVVFGGNPKGDKLYEGDRKTPEGIYRVRDLYPHRSWSKFIWLDYPTAQSWREHLQAKRSGQIDRRLSIGSEIGIHGVPSGADNLIEERSNWTLGCISLKNSDVNEIYSWVRRGTLVEIVP